VVGLRMRLANAHRSAAEVAYGPPIRVTAIGYGIPTRSVKWPDSVPNPSTTM